MVVSFQEPAGVLVRRRWLRGPPFISGTPLMTASQLGLPELYQDILIVEDDPIIALGLEDTILGFGVPTVRVAANVANALVMIEQRAPDFALLDVGLVRGNSFAVAERLAALQIPFAFATGYDADRVPAQFSDRPRLQKPCPTDALEAALRRKT